ncbi:ornithine carbamoyltransferase [uncultured Desulfovibrio sp.]|uniref:ornithine carbamoyltransferase n=1 Tax=uncultured Desulfovibrio sp. TaxID=167968 RepID=UPI001C3B1E27|nr:ornithine carbamoyltransferase [uncultured Desulfovibrio sp.]HIX40004.1 ornithine carbamoyltransferase [Candidatus Desulfovibrio intestinigallinarum]
MARYFMSLSDLGEETAWLLVQQARGIPDAKAPTDFMAERTAALFFCEEAFIERLCVTAAVRQMGGSVVYQGIGSWRQDLEGNYQRELLCQFGYFVDCLYLYGLPASSWATPQWDIITFPVVNAGSPDGHPVHVLADVACMLRYSRNSLKDVTIGWAGCDNGALYSLVEGLRFFPYRLRVALPPLLDRTRLQQAADYHGVHIDFVSTPEEAVEGVDFVFAGCRGGLDDETQEQWRISEALMSRAAPNAHLLLGSTPMYTVQVDRSVLCSPASLLLLQAENRLRVHKRVLHWLFNENEREI